MLKLALPAHAGSSFSTRLKETPSRSTPAIPPSSQRMENPMCFV